MLGEPTTIYFSVSMAAKLVADMNAAEKQLGGDEWEYKLKVAPNDASAVIEVYDNEGYLLGTL